MDAVGIHPIGVYIRRRQEIIAERAACCPIYELLMEAQRMLGMSKLAGWWYQDAVNEPDD